MILSKTIYYNYIKKLNLKTEEIKLKNSALLQNKFIISKKMSEYIKNCNIKTIENITQNKNNTNYKLSIYKPFNFSILLIQFVSVSLFFIYSFYI